MLREKEEKHTSSRKRVIRDLGERFIKELCMLVENPVLYATPPATISLQDFEE